MIRELSQPLLSFAILVLGWHSATAIFAAETATPATEMNYPISIAASAQGTLYVADLRLHGVWQVDGGQLKVLFAGSNKFRTPLNAVRCVALDADGKVVVGDSATRDLYRFDDAGQPQPLTGQGKGYGQIGIPMDIAVDAEGNFFVSDLEIHRIVKVPKSGGKVEEFATVQAPRGLYYDNQKQLWAISGRKLLKFSSDGKSQVVVDEGVFQFPHTVVVKPDGVAYVCDGYAKAIWRVAPGQQPEKWTSGVPLVSPVGMELQGDTLLIADPHAQAIFEISADGKITKRELKAAG